MSTDWFDGRIARSRGRTSELGSLLDPVADKLKTWSQAVAAAVGGLAAAGVWSGFVAR